MPLALHCMCPKKLRVFGCAQTLHFAAEISETGYCCGVVAEEAAASLAPSPLLPNRLSGQEINENGLNGVHKSAFEPVTSSQNKRRKLNPHLSSDSDNHSQPTGSDPVVEEQADQRQ